MFGEYQAVKTFWKKESETLKLLTSWAMSGPDVETSAKLRVVKRDLNQDREGCIYTR